MSLATNAFKEKAARSRVIDYADADPGLRVQMEKIMAPLAQDPADLAAIRSFGAAEAERAVQTALFMRELCKKSGVISKDVLERQRRDWEPERVKAQLALHPFLGVSQEVARRYREDYIPAAQKKFAGSHDPMEALRLKKIEIGLDEFLDRQLLLEGLRTKVIMASSALLSAITTPEETPFVPLTRQAADLRGMTASALAAKAAHNDAAMASITLEAPLRVGAPLRLKLSLQNNRTAGAS